MVMGKRLLRSTKKGKLEVVAWFLWKGRSDIFASGLRCIRFREVLEATSP